LGDGQEVVTSCHGQTYGYYALKRSFRPAIAPFFLTNSGTVRIKSSAEVSFAGEARESSQSGLTSLGEVTTQKDATAGKPGDGPTGGAGTAGLRPCLRWLCPAAGHYVARSQSSHQEVTLDAPNPSNWSGSPRGWCGSHGDFYFCLRLFRLGMAAASGGGAGKIGAWRDGPLCAAGIEVSLRPQRGWP